jgi:hypothetical protein
LLAPPRPCARLECGVLQFLAIDRVLFSWTTHLDDLTIARQRIAREAEERTGFLDLGRLGLSELPDELFELKHLRRLYLGASFFDEAGQPHSSASDFEENFVEAELDRIAKLERRNRTITREQFLRLCEETGYISSTERLLAYLSNAGTVLYIGGFFQDKIIIDQGWVLEAIYTLFDREKCVKRLQRQMGRFTRSDLAEWLWDAIGYSAADQELFIIIMRLCGICFAYRAASPEKDIEAEYIAPDFLPKKSEIAHDLAMKWDTELPCESVLFEYALLHPGLMRGIISRIGSEAGLNADYWRGGGRFCCGNRQPSFDRRGDDRGLARQHPCERSTRPSRVSSGEIEGGYRGRAATTVRDPNGRDGDLLPAGKWDGVHRN